MTPAVSENLCARKNFVFGLGSWRAGRTTLGNEFGAERKQELTNQKRSKTYLYAYSYIGAPLNEPIV